MSKVVDIRVGKVFDVEPNKEGHKLYNENNNFGKVKVSQIASGLRGNTHEEYEVTLETIQNVLNNDVLKKSNEKMNDEINYRINSNKFKVIGNLHKQIMSDSDNGNTVYNRFDIKDDNILKCYKQYYNQLIDFSNTFCDKKLIDIIKDDYNDRINQIENIIISIYNKLDNNNNFEEDIDEIIEIFIREDIKSESDLKSKNILKIIANLAAVIYDCIQNTRIACMQLAFGPKISFGNHIIMENHNFLESLKQFKKIYEIFGIENKNNIVSQ